MLILAERLALATYFVVYLKAGYVFTKNILEKHTKQTKDQFMNKQSSANSQKK